MSHISGQLGGPYISKAVAMATKKRLFPKTICYIDKHFIYDRNMYFIVLGKMPYVMPKKKISFRSNYYMKKY